MHIERTTLCYVCKNPCRDHSKLLELSDSGADTPVEQFAVCDNRECLIKTLEEIRDRTLIETQPPKFPQMIDENTGLRKLADNIYAWRCTVILDLSTGKAIVESSKDKMK